MYAILRRPDNGWPQGEYEVILSSDESNVDPIRYPFSIAAGNSATPKPFTASNSVVETQARSSISNSVKLLGNVTLCQLDDQGDCITEMAVLPVTSPGVRVKANVSTAPVGTTVEARWRYVEGILGASMDIETVSLTKNDEAITWVQSSLKQPEGGWPIGEYEVALSVPPDSADITIKRFFVQ